MNIFFTFLICVFVYFGSTDVLLAAEIDWQLYLKPTAYSGPIISAKTSEGEPFVIDTNDITGSTAGSEDLIEALERVSFFLAQSPVAEPLSIHLKFNVVGNSFESERGISLSMNLLIEIYVSGSKADNPFFFQNAPLVMTIPTGSGLNYLLDMCESGRNDFVFAFSSDGVFEKDGVETSSQIQGMVCYINHTDTIVGGKYSDLGFSSNVRYSTWYKIKKLFE